MSRILARTGLVLLGPGLLLWLGNWWIAGVEPRCADAPLRLERGAAASGTFRAERSGTHWVMLVVPRDMPFEKLAAALGKSWGALAAQEHDHEPILIPWEIRSGDVPLATGPGRGNQGRCGSGSDEALVSLGSFLAERGRPYAFSARVKRTVEPLLGIGTRIAVDVDPLIFKNAFVSAWLLSVCGFLSAVLGAILLAAGLVLGARGSRPRSPTGSP